MLKNHFRIALRNLRRNKFAAAINIGGLAIGMAVAILIGLWICDELTFDHATPNRSRIAQVMKNETFNGVQTWTTLPWQVGDVLKKDYGNLFKYVVMDGGKGEHLLAYGDKKVKPSGDYMGTRIIDMLSLQMLRGNNTALDDETSIILDASTAKELFSDTDPMGKVITLDNDRPVKVTGVYADLPTSSSFNGLGFIAPWQAMFKEQDYETKLTWGNSWFHILVQLKNKVDMAAASKAIGKIEEKYAPGKVTSSNPTLFLQPMDRWHLYSEFKDGVNTGGDIRFVWLFAIIGAFVLLLACINFMNLSTARSEKRAREVGIRKTLGSLHRQLVGQFLCESVLVALLAFVLAIGWVALSLPFFNGLADKDMYIPWGQPVFWLIGVGFTLLTGLLAG